MIEIGHYSLDPDNGVLSEGEAKISLSPKAVGVLLCLAQSPGRVVDRETIQAQVWAGKTVTDTQISKAILELRTAFNDTQTPGQLIEALPNRGYRLLATVGAPPTSADPNIPTFTGRSTRVAVVILLLAAGLVAYQKLLVPLMVKPTATEVETNKTSLADLPTTARA